MSVFGNIISAIFGRGGTAGAATTAATGSSPAATQPVSPAPGSR